MSSKARCYFHQLYANWPFITAELHANKASEKALDDHIWAIIIGDNSSELGEVSRVIHQLSTSYPPDGPAGLWSGHFTKRLVCRSKLFLSVRDCKICIILILYFLAFRPSGCTPSSYRSCWTYGLDSAMRGVASQQTTDSPFAAHNARIT